MQHVDHRRHRSPATNSNSNMLNVEPLNATDCAGQAQVQQQQQQQRRRRLKLQQLQNRTRSFGYKITTCRMTTIIFCSITVLLMLTVSTYGLFLIWMRQRQLTTVVLERQQQQQQVHQRKHKQQAVVRLDADSSSSERTIKQQEDIRQMLGDALPRNAQLKACHLFGEPQLLCIASATRSGGDTMIVYYNGMDRERYLRCDNHHDILKVVKLPPNSATLVRHNSGGDCDTPPRDAITASIFEIVPTVENAHQLPPITLRFQNSQRGGELFPDCNVPCLHFGTPDVHCRRTVELPPEYGSTTTTPWQFVFSMEGPAYYSTLRRDPNAWRRNQFYATTSFTEAEIPLPYYSRAEYTIQNKHPPVDFDQAIPGAVFLARNCNSMNQREDVVKELMQHKELIRIDSLSQCLHNRDPPAGVRLNGPKQDILRHYLFYLALENQCVDDYITEKLWQPLEAGVVPVYYGAPNVLDHVPPNSIIRVQDFDTTAALAQHLHTVAHDPALYASYHAWRQHPLPRQFHQKYDMTDTHSTCRTCRWVYARLYGLGWNHTAQQLRELIVPRQPCLQHHGLVVRPFRESWTTTAATVEGKEGEEKPLHMVVVNEHNNNNNNENSQSECRPILRDNRSISLQSKNNENTIRLQRTVHYRDGATDFLVEATPRNDDGGGGNNSNNNNNNVVSLHLHTTLQPSASLRLVRDGVWHWQDAASRFTLLVSTSAGLQKDVVPTVRQHDSSIIVTFVEQQMTPLRLRIWVEDLDTFHDGADQVESYFGQSLADSFFKPLQTFAVVVS